MSIPAKILCLSTSLFVFLSLSTYTIAMEEDKPSPKSSPKIFPWKNSESERIKGFSVDINKFEELEGKAQKIFENKEDLRTIKYLAMNPYALDIQYDDLKKEVQNPYLNPQDLENFQLEILLINEVFRNKHKHYRNRPCFRNSVIPQSKPVDSTRPSLTRTASTLRTENPKPRKPSSTLSRMESKSSFPQYLLENPIENPENDKKKNGGWCVIQ